MEGMEGYVLIVWGDHVLGLPEMHAVLVLVVIAIIIMMAIIMMAIAIIEALTTIVVKAAKKASCS